MRLSIVVPILNEEGILRAFLQELRAAAPESEIIVADGGSQDASLEIARELSDQVVQTSRGRALQMNAGAKLASGDVFWFLHADSTVVPGFSSAIEEALRDQTMVGGCFQLEIDSPKWIYRARDLIGNFLVGGAGIALGDRGFFCRNEIFFRIGGYPETPIMEDAEFYRVLKRHGRVRQLREKIKTSPRRYEALGPIRTAIFYALVMTLFAMRVPLPLLRKIVRWYVVIPADPTSVSTSARCGRADRSTDQPRVPSAE